MLNETGTLEPQYNGTRTGKIDLSKLQKVVEARPDAYLSGLAIQFGCKRFLRAEKTGNHGKKKTFTYSEKCEVKRYLYILLLIIFVIALNVTNIIFADESGINAYYQ